MSHQEASLPTTKTETLTGASEGGPAPVHFGHYVVERARQVDWEVLKALLAAHGMASIGVREHIGNYVLAKDSNFDSVGCAGLEHQGDVGVLRSVVVSLPHRGHGLGSLFIAKLICYAKRASLRHAVLVADVPQRSLRRSSGSTKRVRSSSPWLATGPAS